MRHDFSPHPQEAAFFRSYTAELREDFQSGLLKELTPYPQFVVWRYKLEQGTFKKPPVNPRTHHPASVDNPRTWGTIRQALGALSTGYFHGIGFVLTRNDPFTGIDLDHCVEKNGNIAPWAKQIIEQLDTYTEISPSEKGIRMFVEGVTPGGKFDNVEMWSNTHYMTITTRHIDGTSTAIEKRQEALDSVYRQCVPAFPPPIQNTQNTWVGRVEQPSLVLATLPDEASQDTNLQSLLDGETADYNGDESIADFVTLMKLMHYTADDREWTKAIFASHPIGQRAKSRENTKEGRRGNSTYLDYTIDAVLRKRRNPPMNRKTNSSEQ